MSAEDYDYEGSQENRQTECSKELENSDNGSSNSGEYKIQMSRVSAPEQLQVTNLSLLTHAECEHGYNVSIPRYLLCHNASFGGSCNVSYHLFLLAYSKIRFLLLAFILAKSYWRKRTFRALHLM